MSRGYLFTAALIVVLLLGGWIVTSPDPVRQGDGGSRAHPPPGVVFATNYPVNEREWVSPQEIAQPDGNRAVVLHE